MARTAGAVKWGNARVTDLAGLQAWIEGEVQRWAGHGRATIANFATVTGVPAARLRELKSGKCTVGGARGSRVIRSFSSLQRAHYLSFRRAALQTRLASGRVGGDPDIGAALLRRAALESCCELTPLPGGLRQPPLRLPKALDTEPYAYRTNRIRNWVKGTAPDSETLFPPGKAVRIDDVVADEPGAEPVLMRRGNADIELKGAVAKAVRAGKHVVWVGARAYVISPRAPATPARSDVNDADKARNRQSWRRVAAALERELAEAAYTAEREVTAGHVTAAEGAQIGLPAGATRIVVKPLEEALGG